VVSNRPQVPSVFSVRYDRGSWLAAQAGNASRNMLHTPSVLCGMTHENTEKAGRPQNTHANFSVTATVRSEQHPKKAPPPRLEIKKNDSRTRTRRDASSNGTPAGCSRVVAGNPPAPPLPPPFRLLAPPPTPPTPPPTPLVPPLFPLLFCTRVSLPDALMGHTMLEHRPRTASTTSTASIPSGSVMPGGGCNGRSPRPSVA
jgi:hypothetical protein